MLNRMWWRLARRALHSTAAIVIASGNAARGPMIAAAARAPTALTEIDPVSSTSSERACPRPTRPTIVTRPTTSVDDPKMNASRPAAVPRTPTSPTRKPRRRRHREEARRRWCVRARCPPALCLGEDLGGGLELRLDGLAGRLRHDASRVAAILGMPEQELVRRVEDAVTTLELRAIDGQVGLVDELVRLLPVARVRRDPDRDGGADRLARRLHLEEPSPQPLGGSGRRSRTPARASSRAEGSRTPRRRSVPARRNREAPAGRRPRCR